MHEPACRRSTARLASPLPRCSTAVGVSDGLNGEGGRGEIPRAPGGRYAPARLVARVGPVLSTWVPTPGWSLRDAATSDRPSSKHVPRGTPGRPLEWRASAPRAGPAEAGQHVLRAGDDAKGCQRTRRERHRQALRCLLVSFRDGLAVCRRPGELEATRHVPGSQAKVSAGLRRAPEPVGSAPRAAVRPRSGGPCAVPGRAISTRRVPAVTATVAERAGRSVHHGECVSSLAPGRGHVPPPGTRQSFARCSTWNTRGRVCGRP